MKEIYKVQTPKRIVFGDPLYFEEFSGARLEQLVVDVQPPEAFGARVVLREFSAAEAPDTLIRTMEVYLAPEEDMDIYLRGMKYELQECIEKEIGVDTARYYLQVDDREETDQVRAAWDALGLFDRSHCESETDGQLKLEEGQEQDEGEEVSEEADQGMEQSM